MQLQHVMHTVAMVLILSSVLPLKGATTTTTATTSTTSTKSIAANATTAKPTTTVTAITVTHVCRSFACPAGYTKNEGSDDEVCSIGDFVHGEHVVACDAATCCTAVPTTTVAPTTTSTNTTSTTSTTTTAITCANYSCPKWWLPLQDTVICQNGKCNRERCCVETPPPCAIVAPLAAAPLAPTKTTTPWPWTAVPLVLQTVVKPEGPCAPAIAAPSAAAPIAPAETLSPFPCTTVASELQTIVTTTPGLVGATLTATPALTSTLTPWSKVILKPDGPCAPAVVSRMFAPKGSSLAQGLAASKEDGTMPSWMLVVLGGSLMLSVVVMLAMLSHRFHNPRFTLVEPLQQMDEESHLMGATE